MVLDIVTFGDIRNETKFRSIRKPSLKSPTAPSTSITVYPTGRRTGSEMMKRLLENLKVRMTIIQILGVMTWTEPEMKISLSRPRTVNLWILGQKDTFDGKVWK